MARAIHKNRFVMAQAIQKDRIRLVYFCNFEKGRHLLRHPICLRAHQAPSKIGSTRNKMNLLPEGPNLPFIVDLSFRRKTTQWAHNVKMTSYQRRCDVITSHRRWYDVILMLCACWEPVFQDPLPLKVYHLPSTLHDCKLSYYCTFET